MLTAKDVTTTKLFPSGAWEVSAILSGRLIRKAFYGYTKREAVRLFVEEYKHRA